MSARHLVVRAAAALVLLVPAPLLAQGPTWLTGVEARGISYQSQTGFFIKSVSEVSIPVAVIWPVNSRLAFDVGGRWATATRKGTDTTATISGLTDIQARGVYQIVPDLLALTVSANLPTGKTNFTGGQLLTAGAIASDLLPYPVANFGSGFNVTSGLAVAVPVGGWAVGVAGSYRVNGSFTSAAGSYRAGGEFRVRAGADRIIGQSRVSFGFTYSGFGEDNLASSPIFQSGNRYIGQGSWSFPVGNVGLQVYAWDLYRAPGSQLFGSPVPMQKSNVLSFGTAASVQLGTNVLRPQVEFRMHWLGDSTLATAGRLLAFALQYEMTLNARFSLLPSVRFDTGNENLIDGNGNPTAPTASFTGWNVGLMLRART